MRNGASSALVAILLAACTLSAAGAQDSPSPGKPNWTDPPAKRAASGTEAGKGMPDAKAATAPDAASAPPAKTPSKASSRSPSEKSPSETRAKAAGRIEAKAARKSARREPESRVAERAAVRRAPRVSAHRFGEPAPRGADPAYRQRYGAEPVDPRWVRVRMPPPGRVLVQGRTVQFPDGRTLRVYRPRGDEDEID